MNYWFIILLIIYSIKLGTHMTRHGEKVEMKYHFWGALFGLGFRIFVIYKAIQVGF